MLMQTIEEPHAAQLPPQAERLLKALQAPRGVWRTRSDIAATLGKNRLNPGDTAMLEMLAAQGVIEVQRVTDATPIGYRWEYRSK